MVEPAYEAVYHTYDEMEEYLTKWVDAHEEICELGTIGTSSEGRELMIVTVTDKSTGPADSKPGCWVDGNTHAGEVTGCEACLHFLYTLLSDYAAGDPSTLEMLRTSTIYVVPKVSPDGAELYLTSAYSLRASTILWPNAESPPGFLPEDLTGDGEILVMRVKDSAGTFKICEEDERLLTPRAPQDNDPAGEYYNLLPEGLYKDFDGFHKEPSTRWGLDTNRQYPAKWEPGEQTGPHPLFVPEAEAVAKAVTARANICTLLTYHTHGGEVREPLDATDEDDLNTFKQLTAQGLAQTGYQKVRSGIGGAFLRWAYTHRGIVAYLTECWDLLAKAGIEDILAWCEKELPAGTYWQDWTPFDHPQLGPVEVGGWKWKMLAQNPPPAVLLSELEGNTQFALTLAQCLPRVKVSAVECLPMGGDCTRVRVSLRNEGFLPSYAAKQAIESHVVKPEASITLELGAGQELIAGETIQSVPHLEGRAQSSFGTSPINPFMANQLAGGKGWFVSNKHETRAEWVVKGSGSVTVSADFARAGVVTEVVALAAPAGASL